MCCSWLLYIGKFFTGVKTDRGVRIQPDVEDHLILLQSIHVPLVLGEALSENICLMVSERIKQRHRLPMFQSRFRSIPTMKTYSRI